MGQLKTDEFEALLAEAQKPLRDFLSGLVGGHANVADVLQETNIAIWEKREQFEKDTDFSAWIFTIARFKALSFNRDFGRNKLRYFGEEMESLLANKAAEILPNLPERLEALRICIDELSAEDRELLLARYQRGQTVSALAKTYGLSENAAYQKISRLRRKLGDLIKGLLMN